MKKTYIAPVVDSITASTTNILAVSVSLDNGETSIMHSNRSHDMELDDWDEE